MGGITMIEVLNLSMYFSHDPLTQAQQFKRITGDLCYLVVRVTSTGTWYETCSGRDASQVLPPRSGLEAAELQALMHGLSLVWSH